MVNPVVTTSKIQCAQRIPKTALMIGQSNMNRVITALLFLGSCQILSLMTKCSLLVQLANNPIFFTKSTKELFEMTRVLLPRRTNLVQRLHQKSSRVTVISRNLILWMLAVSNRILMWNSSKRMNLGKKLKRRLSIKY